MNKSRQFDKLLIKDLSDIVKKDTSALYVKGGGFFQKGIIIGDNNSTERGAIRYHNNQFEVNNGKWQQLATIEPCDNCISNLVKIGENGLSKTDIVINNNNLDSVKKINGHYFIEVTSIEDDYIHIKIGNVEKKIKIEEI